MESEAATQKDTIQQAAIFLGVQAITVFVNNVISIIPPLIQAGLLVIVGYSLAIYMKERIVTSKTLYADVAGKTVFFLILYLSIAMALSQINIDTTLVNNILLLIVAGVSFGLAIALGLGLRDVVSSSAKDYTQKFKKGRRPENVVIGLGSSQIRGVSKSYDAVKVGSPVALFGSRNLLEISVNQADAHTHFKANIGQAIKVNLNCAKVEDAPDPRRPRVKL